VFPERINEGVRPFWNVGGMIPQTVGPDGIKGEKGESQQAQAFSLCFLATML
jgi:hypothetical protein